MAQQRGVRNDLERQQKLSYGDELKAQMAAQSEAKQRERMERMGIGPYGVAPPQDMGPPRGGPQGPPMGGGFGGYGGFGGFGGFGGLGQNLFGGGNPFMGGPPPGQGPPGFGGFQKVPIPMEPSPNIMNMNRMDHLNSKQQYRMELEAQMREKEERKAYEKAKSMQEEMSRAPRQQKQQIAEKNYQKEMNRRKEEDEIAREEARLVAGRSVLHAQYQQDRGEGGGPNGMSAEDKVAAAWLKAKEESDDLKRNKYAKMRGGHGGRAPYQGHATRLRERKKGKGQGGGPNGMSDEHKVAAAWLKAKEESDIWRGTKQDDGPGDAPPTRREMDKSKTMKEVAVGQVHHKVMREQYSPAMMEQKARAIAMDEVDHVRREMVAEAANLRRVVEDQSQQFLLSTVYLSLPAIPFPSLAQHRTAGPANTRPGGGSTAKLARQDGTRVGNTGTRARNTALGSATPARGGANTCPCGGATRPAGEGETPAGGDAKHPASGGGEKPGPLGEAKNVPRLNVMIDLPPHAAVARRSVVMHAGFSKQETVLLYPNGRAEVPESRAAHAAAAAAASATAQGLSTADLASAVELPPPSKEHSKASLGEDHTTQLPTHQPSASTINSSKDQGGGLSALPSAPPQPPAAAPPPAMQRTDMPLIREPSLTLRRPSPSKQQMMSELNKLSKTDNVDEMDAFLAKFAHSKSGAPAKSRGPQLRVETPTKTPNPAVQQSYQQQQANYIIPQPAPSSPQSQPQAAAPARPSESSSNEPQSHVTIGDAIAGAPPSRPSSKPPSRLGDLPPPAPASAHKPPSSPQTQSQAAAPARPSESNSTAGQNATTSVAIARATPSRATPQPTTPQSTDSKPSSAASSPHPGGSKAAPTSKPPSRSVSKPPSVAASPRATPQPTDTKPASVLASSRSTPQSTTSTPRSTSGGAPAPASESVRPSPTIYKPPSGSPRPGQGGERSSAKSPSDPSSKPPSQPSVFPPTAPLRVSPKPPSVAASTPQSSAPSPHPSKPPTQSGGLPPAGPSLSRNGSLQNGSQARVASQTSSVTNLPPLLSKGSSQAGSRRASDAGGK
eukprot:gene24014-9589_t